MAKEKSATSTDSASARARETEAWRAKRKAIFIEALAERGIVKRACVAANIDRQTAYNWYRDDPAFAAAWKDALEDATDLMENEALRRAVDGVERPVFQGGIQVGAVTEYSDALLLQMLRANRPEKHRDRTSVEVTGKDGGPVEFANLSDEELRQRAAVILGRSSGTSGAGA